MAGTATQASFVARVRGLSGIEDEATARLVASAVTSVLFEQLPASDRALLARALPDDLAMSPAVHRPADSLHDVYERVAVREGVDTGFAAEHTQSVCQAITEQLDDDARASITSGLPAELAELFTVPDRGLATLPTSHQGAQQPRRTLSEGRPSSRHPISEGAPLDAQADSVARRPDPHADTKLSSAAGTTQEREHETLAETGKPPRTRTRQP